MVTVFIGQSTVVQTVDQCADVERAEVRDDRNALHVHAARVAPERFTLEDVIKHV